MRSIILALALTLGAPATAALASETHGAVTDTVRDSLTQRLVNEGYEVRRIAREDGLYEVYALRDGQRFELYFNEALEPVNRRGSDND
ncbi:MAG: hypothetical protein Kow0013_15330 [Pararhodobacter sp.]